MTKTNGNKEVKKKIGRPRGRYKHKLTLKLPLEYVHELKRKNTVKKVAFSLNGFLAKLKGNSKSNRYSGYYHYLAKQYMIDCVNEQLDGQRPFPANTKYPLKAVLTIHRKNRSMFDIDNTIILVKFANDIIKEEHIPEDNYKYIGTVELKNGTLDREDPHAILEIMEDDDIYIPE